MRLKEGAPAVDFFVSDYKNRPVRLAEHRGHKVLLSFFRDAFCPFCNLRVHHLIKNFDEFNRFELDIIAFFAASKEDVYENAGQQRAPFPIVADPDLRWYKEYGVESSPMGLFRAVMNPVAMFKVMKSGFFNLASITKKPLIPADFLIDEHQVIQKAYYGQDYGDHIPINEILSWIKIKKLST